MKLQTVKYFSGVLKKINYVDFLGAEKFSVKFS
jgi:hypothetical protein